LSRRRSSKSLARRVPGSQRLYARKAEEYDSGKVADLLEHVYVQRD